MRTLNKNKIALWVTSPNTKTRETDSDGNYTGEYITTFKTPTKIYINLYPATGEIVEEIFGKSYDCDMVAVSIDVILDKDTLLFYTQPTSDYNTTYDFRVDRILTSLNNCQYGLKRRT